MSMVQFKRPVSYQKEAEFFGRLMQITGKAHLTHLRQFTKSGWEHKALNTLYEDVVDIVDGFIEGFFGIYGTFDFSIPSSSPEPDAEQFVRSTYDYIQQNRHIFSESWLQNILDEILHLLAQTLYRLRNVK